jgi:DNA-binding transcriptional regulator YiaG
VTTIRKLRLATKLSQAEFAKRLGVSLESCRLWDSGRRNAPAAALDQARALAAAGPDDVARKLPDLARLLGVSVYRLREAARDGRLAVAYDNHVVFGHCVPRATRAAGEEYQRQYYGKKARWTPRPAPPPAFPDIPPDYDRRLVQLRKDLALSQSQLAERIGAAGKAVVYQWESRKRRPSRLLWSRVRQLGAPEPVGNSVNRDSPEEAESKASGRPTDGRTATFPQSSGL